MEESADRSARDLALLFLTAQFRAAGLAVVAIPLLPLVGAPKGPDGVLLAALALLAGGCAGVRALVRRGILSVRGAGMTAALLVLVTLLTVCIQRTGGPMSPLVLLLGTLVATGGLLLAPLALFQLLAGVCLLFAVMVVATADGLVPPAIHGEGGAAPFSLLIVELGLLALVGFLVNALAWRIREQQSELTLHDIRDADTGALRQGFFHAGLVALLEQVRDGLDGVTLLVVDLGAIREADVREAGAILRDGARRDDVVGRVGPARFAVAFATVRHDGARRLLDRLRPLNRALSAGIAQVATADLGRDTVDCARRLYADAEKSVRRAA